MFRKNKFKIAFSILFMALIFVLWPVYEFYAYKGKVAFFPFYQFVDIPTNSPRNQKSNEDYYQMAGNNALDILEHHKKSIHAPAISAAVAIDGNVVWAGATGWADIEKSIPVTPQTQFRIGSTSKAVTGTALARLVDANVVDLDTPISQYMNDIPNDEWQNITLRQLASHMSGLPHYITNTDYLGLLKTVYLSTYYENVIDALEVFDESKLLFNPGTEFRYSSLGTVLLSAVMQEAKQKHFQEIVKNQVFTPLGMNSSMPESEGKNSPNLATFYWNNEGASQKVRPWRDVDLSHRLAGGGFISTSTDLAKMGIAYLDHNYITKSARNTFWTPQQLPDGRYFGDTSKYAISWRVTTFDNGEGLGLITFINHGGVSRGAQSWLMILPEYNMSVAVNINSNTDVFWDFAKVSLTLAKEFIDNKKLLLSK